MATAQSWPEALDALTASPEYHTLLLENASVRVLDTRVPPGRTVPLHTHRWPAALYILSWSDFVRRDELGATLVDTRIAGSQAVARAVWSAPLTPHTLENVGEGFLRVLCVEIKDGGI